jgi:hypothetical protein
MTFAANVLGQRKAHHGMSVGERWPDPILAWPEPYVKEVLQAFARWSVTHQQPIYYLFSMCCKGFPLSSI